MTKAPALLKKSLATLNAQAALYLHFMWSQRGGTGKDDEHNEICINIHMVSLRAKNCNLPDIVKNNTILLMPTVRDKTHKLQRALILLVQSLFSFLFLLVSS